MVERPQRTHIKLRRNTTLPENNRGFGRNGTDYGKDRVKQTIKGYLCKKKRKTSNEIQIKKHKNEQ